MKKRNKVVALLLAATLCGSALVGCGAKGEETLSNPTENNSSQSEVSSEQTEANGASSEVVEGPLKNVDIYPLDCDKTFTIVSAHASVEDGSSIVTKRMEEATGVSIEWVYMAQDQFRLALSSKELPDAVFAQYVEKELVRQYGEAGYIVNIMDYIDIMPNFKAAIEANPDMLDAVQNEDGSVYMFPRKYMSNTADSNMLYYRTDMMKEIGWDNPPATTDEFLQYIKELQEHFGAKDPEYVAFSSYTSGHMNWDGSYIPCIFFPAFGPLVRTVMTVDPDENVVLGAATEQYKYYLEFMNEVWNSGAFDTNAYTLEATTSQGKAAGNHVGVSSAHNGHTLAQFESGNFDLDVMPPLTSEYWDEPHWYQKSSVAVSPAYFITTECEDIETLIKWFDAWYSTYDNPLDEEGTFYAITPFLGKIGTDYDLNEETLIYTELEHEGVEIGTFMAKEAFGSPLYSGYDNGKFPYSLERTVNLGVKGAGVMENLWPYGETPVDLSLYSLSVEDSDEYNRIWADILAFVKEWSAQFITGERSIADDWDDYLVELERIGLKDATDILQKYYDADKK